MISNLRVFFFFFLLSDVGGYLQPLDSLLLRPPSPPLLLRIRNGGMETEDVEGAKLAG